MSSCESRIIGPHPRSTRESGHRGPRKGNHLRIPAFLFFGVLLSSQANGQASPSLTPPKNIIRGVVVNSVTREPVGHALVVSGDNRLATMTDDEGRFEIVFPQAAEDRTSDLPESQTRVEVVFSGVGGGSPGMLSARKPGFLGLDPRLGIRNETQAIPGKDATTITLVPEARIVGHVVLPDANSSDRIPVQLYRRQVVEGRAQWTNVRGIAARSNGEFRFAELEPGTYKLFTGELPDLDPLTRQPGGPSFGYPPMYFPNATDFQSAGTIQLTPGTTFQAELVPVRRAYFPVKIPVTNLPAGEDLEVNVSTQGRKGPGFGLSYSAREQRIEGELPNGSYLIEATSAGANAEFGAVNITVKGGAVEGPAMALVPGASVRFKARMEFQKEADSTPPEARVEGEVTSTGVRVLRTYGAGALGSFGVILDSADEVATRGWGTRSESRNEDSAILGGVPPGRYWVRVLPGRGFAAAITMGEVDLLRQPLTVGLGSSLAVDVTIRDVGAELSGTIEDGEGRPLATGASPVMATDGSIIGAFSARLAQVYCIPLPESTGQFRQAEVLPDGKFDLQQVPPGAYRVLAFDRPQMELEYRSSQAMSAYDGKGKVVRLGAGQKETITLPVISTSE